MGALLILPIQRKPVRCCLQSIMTRYILVWAGSVSLSPQEGRGPAVFQINTWILLTKRWLIANFIASVSSQLVKIDPAGLGIRAADQNKHSSTEQKYFLMQWFVNVRFECVRFVKIFYILPRFHLIPPPAEDCIPECFCKCWWGWEFINQISLQGGERGGSGLGADMSPDDSNQTIYHRHGESIISLWQPQPLPDMFPYPKVEFFSTYHVVNL